MFPVFRTDHENLRSFSEKNNMKSQSDDPVLDVQIIIRQL